MSHIPRTTLNKTRASHDGRMNPFSLVCMVQVDLLWDSGNFHLKIQWLCRYLCLPLACPVPELRADTTWPVKVVAAVLDLVAGMQQKSEKDTRNATKIEQCCDASCQVMSHGKLQHFTSFAFQQARKLALSVSGLQRQRTVDWAVMLNKNHIINKQMNR